MRNSVGAQSLHYYKVGTYDGKTTDELIQIIEDLAAKISLVEKNQTEGAKEPEFDDQVFKKKRQDILYLLNNKDGYKSKDATLDKYEIKFSEKLAFGVSIVLVINTLIMYARRITFTM